MKRVFFILILFLISVFTLGQTETEISKTFVSEICQQTNGTIEEQYEEYNDDYLAKIIIVKLPSHYDTELAVMSINNIVSQYNDIKVISSWEKIGQANYSLELQIAGKIAMVLRYRQNLLYCGWAEKKR